jgi:hypothetical protein
MYKTGQANLNSASRNCVYVRATEHKRSLERRVARHFGIARATDLTDLTDRVANLLSSPTDY